MTGCTSQRSDWINNISQELSKMERSACDSALTKVDKKVAAESARVHTTLPTPHVKRIEQVCSGVCHPCSLLKSFKSETMRTAYLIRGPRTNEPRPAAKLHPARSSCATCTNSPTSGVGCEGVVRAFMLPHVPTPKKENVR